MILLSYLKLQEMAFGVKAISMYNFLMCLSFWLVGVWLVFFVAVKVGMVDEAFTGIVTLAYLLIVCFFIYFIRRS